MLGPPPSLSYIYIYISVGSSSKAIQSSGGRIMPSSRGQSQSFVVEGNININKTLYICFAGDPMGYAIRSVPGNTLFNQNNSPSPTEVSPKRKRTKSSSSSSEDNNHHQTPIILLPGGDVWSNMDDSACTGIGCGTLGSTNIYFVGGLQPDFFGKNPDIFQFHTLLRSNERFSKSVFVYDTRSSSYFSVPDMICPKANPMVLAVGERLYVLAGYPSDNTPDPAFEAYTPSTKSWEPLDPPPFLQPESKYYDCRRDYLGYAVIGGGICVSTNRASFKFDLEKKIWEPCLLFDSFPEDSLHSPWVDTEYVHEWMSIRDPTPCGLPFGFRGQAVLFGNDTLICMVRSNYGAIVAYLMSDDGKVVRSQSFRAQGLLIPTYTYTSCIADFGNGFFCLVLTEHVHDFEICEPTYLLTLKPFLIKKKTELELLQGLDDEFLLCEVVNEFNYTYRFEDEKVDTLWHPIGCLVR